MATNQFDRYLICHTAVSLNKIHKLLRIFFKHFLLTDGLTMEIWMSNSVLMIAVTVDHMLSVTRFSIRKHMFIERKHTGHRDKVLWWVVPTFHRSPDVWASRAITDWTDVAHWAMGNRTTKSRPVPTIYRPTDLVLQFVVGKNTNHSAPTSSTSNCINGPPGMHFAINNCLP